jgi:hypothetical protein
MANIGTLIKASSIGKKLAPDFKYLKFDDTAIGMLKNIGNLPIGAWGPLALRPFDDYVIELLDKTSDVTIAAVGYGPYTFFYFDIKNSAGKIIGVRSAGFRFFWCDPEDDYETQQILAEELAVMKKAGIDWEQIQREAWGLNNKDQNFPMIMVIPESVDFVAHSKSEPGYARDMLAAFALLSIEREVIEIPASFRSGRAFINTDSVPSYEPVTVFIRPNAPRVIIQKAEDAAKQERLLREHDVRSHWRILNRGTPAERRVPVKSHKRGDPELGRVEKSYVVELDPLAEVRASTAKKLIKEDA